MEMYGTHKFPGKLFIVEGIDGSGKSTQLALLRQWLESENYIVVSSEWNSSPLVRRTTRRGKRKRMLTPTTFSLIHATDFADRTEREIIPPLKAGAIVLADRYVYTAYARDVVRGVDADWVRRIYRFAVKPTVGFYFRIPLDIAMRRITSARDSIKYYEAGMDLGFSADLAKSFRIFQGRIVAEYEKMMGEFGLTVIDATKPIEEQQEEVRAIVRKTMAGLKKSKVRTWVNLSTTVKGFRE
ncbi:MAG: thymidylate kinase [Acidobacteria bacterium]|nr:thymidylate kinase [Acidobacteriota bacterium]MBI3657256.1 thymidylate kinase [Acidobacteriota bacterium]